MSVYIARIELKGEPPKAKYDELHAAMAGMCFLRTMATRAGNKELPQATYCNMSCTETLDVVAKRINAAACNIQRACNVIVIESDNSYTWNNA
jgi:hypothetical protein